MSRMENRLFDNATAKRNFIFLLSPGFSLHSLGCATEPLAVANRALEREVYTYALVSEDGQPVRSSCGFEIAVTGELDKRSIDDFLVVCDGLTATDYYSTKVLSWLRQHSGHGGFVGSFGNGTYALAQAGLLDGRRFTTHWQNREALRENYPELFATANIYELDRRVATCAGGSTASDMMLEFIARDFDRWFANRVAEVCQHPANRSSTDKQRAPLSAILRTRNAVLIEIVRQMQANLEDPLSLDDLARLNRISRRQVERLFRQTIGISPGKYYKGLRLEHARRLVRETDLSISEIAFASGFNALASFNKNFRAAFSVSPCTQRKQYSEGRGADAAV